MSVYGWAFEQLKLRRKPTQAERHAALVRGYRKYLADRMDEFNSGAMAERMLEELQRIEERQ